MDDPGEATPEDSVSPKRAVGRRLRRVCLFLLLLAGFGESARRWGPEFVHEFRYRQAAHLLDSGEFEQAALGLEALIEGRPRETRARLSLARAYRRLDRITEAEETLQRAVELGLPITQARAEHDLLKATTRPEPSHIADR